MSWMTRIANAFRPESTASHLDDELQFHIHQRTDDLVRGGMPRREAERAARRQLGNALRIRESSQEVKSSAWIESLLHDFRFGLRMLARRFWKVVDHRIGTKAQRVCRPPPQSSDVLREVAEHLPPALVNLLGRRRRAIVGPHPVSRFQWLAGFITFDSPCQSFFEDTADKAIR